MSDPTERPARRERGWLLAAILLSLTYVAVLAATAPDMGYTRDEGYYFKAAEQYGAWWDTLFSKRFVDAFGDAEIKARFGYNTEHPALIKLTQGVTYRVLHQWLGLTGPAQGFRFTGFLFGGLSLFATFLLGRALASSAIGFVAALFVAVMPRYFYDAHLACFDVPITAMWTLSLLAFWRGLTAPEHRVKKTALVAGVVFGLALATKLNALFLPFVFVALWLHRAGLRGLFGLAPGPSGARDLALPKIPLVLWSCAIVGPLVFLAHWPYLWHDTFARIGFYIGFHGSHEHYPIRYFGEVFVKPPFPWHFSWVMTAFTVPSPILALGTLGVGVAAWRALVHRRTDELLLVIGALLPIAIISLPGTPIFGGVKHWYNALPAIAILAARALFDGAALTRRALPGVTAKLAAPALCALAALPGVLGIAASHPNGIAFYNELAGGIRGAAELGFQRSFWGGLSRPLLADLAKLPPGTRVFFDHTNYDAYRMYVREGSLPSSIGFSDRPEDGRAATLFIDREGYPPSEEAAFSSASPVPIRGVYVDEVPLVQLHVAPALAPAITGAR
ncbi:glycosyltransferase family 39 protein [Myxococcota bacterium]|nr:glycosyltransferase family 39 protein [Myxococcota bacterium]